MVKGAKSMKLVSWLIMVLFCLWFWLEFLRAIEFEAERIECMKEGRCKPWVN